MDTTAWWTAKDLSIKGKELLEIGRIVTIEHISSSEHTLDRDLWRRINKLGLGTINRTRRGRQGVEIEHHQLSLAYQIANPSTTNQTLFPILQLVVI